MHAPRHCQLLDPCQFVFINVHRQNQELRCCQQTSSFISASHDVQMLYNMIQIVNWALLSTDKGFKKVDSLTEGFYKNKCVRFCSLPKTRLTQTLGPWVFCLLLSKNKQTFWTGGLKVLSWTYLFQCLETVH